MTPLDLWGARFEACFRSKPFANFRTHSKYTWFQSTPKRIIFASVGRPCGKGQCFLGRLYTFLIFFEHDFHLQKVTFELSGPYSNSNSPCTPPSPPGPPTTTAGDIAIAGNSNIATGKKTPLHSFPQHFHQAPMHPPIRLPNSASEKTLGAQPRASRGSTKMGCAPFCEDFSDFTIQETCIGTFNFLLYFQIVELSKQWRRFESWG